MLRDLPTLDQVSHAMWQVILNPAPASPLPAETYLDVDHLILNSSEAILLCKSLPDNSISSTSERQDPDHMDDKTLNDIVADFINAGTAHVIITLGSRGCFYQTLLRYSAGQGGIFIPAVKVSKVVDTTGAGDAFVGAYAAKVAEGLGSRRREIEVNQEGKGRAKGIKIDEAVEYAIKVSGKSVQIAGARGGVPWGNEPL